MYLLVCSGYRGFFIHMDAPRQAIAQLNRRPASEVMDRVAKKLLPGYKPIK